MNELDKKKRKQGEWIFFDRLGNAEMSCRFINDSCVSPMIFYKNSDTSFIRFPKKDSIEPFMLYKANKVFFGNFISRKDSSILVEIDPDPAINDKIIDEIKKYQNIKIAPNYYFMQKKILDYTSAVFTASNFTFNKPLSILLTIDKAGFVINVQFPADKNNLSATEERELYLMYANMPRWQPFFSKNNVQECKIQLSNNATISVISN